MLDNWNDSILRKAESAIRILNSIDDQNARRGKIFIYRVDEF